MSVSNVQRVDFRSDDGQNTAVITKGNVVRYEHLTLERLREALDYDPDTGIFRWKVRSHKKSRLQIGDVAGSQKVAPNGRSYRVISIDGRAYQATQLAFFWVKGRWARGLVGQENGVRDDLRAENLIEMRTTVEKHDLSTKEGRSRHQRDYWDNNPDYRREIQFKKLYGITYADYARMLAEQDGLCAICKKPETSVQDGKVRFLAVDHCHNTGLVRGLLCMNCNSAIGRLGDDPDMLDRAAAYLRHHAATAAEKEAA